MNENKPAVPSPFEGLPERKAFSASRREIWIALAMYIAAYLYIDRIFFHSIDGMDSGGSWLAGFTLLMIGMTEALHWKKPRPAESWIWLGCLV